MQLLYELIRGYAFKSTKCENSDGVIMVAMDGILHYLIHVFICDCGLNICVTLDCF